MAYGADTTHIGDEGRGGGGAGLLTEEAVLGQVTPVIMLSGCLLS